MHPRLPVVIMFALALAAPGVSYDKDKDKDKSKNKGQSEQKAEDREGDRDDDGDHGDHDGNQGGKITICHVPPGNHSARHSITVGESAWQAHQGHGDHKGACGSGGGGTCQDRRFNDLDRNRNGVVSADEWPGDRGTFDRLDRNDNGVISCSEFTRN